MKLENRFPSSSIEKSIIDRPFNKIFQAGIRFIARKINFDEGSLQILKEFQSQDKKGKFVYASYNNAHTPLMIFIHLLKKNGFNLPDLAMDFSPNGILSVSTLFKASVFWYKKFFLKNLKPITDIEYLEAIFDEDLSIVFSLMSSGYFEKRFFKKKKDSIEFLVEVQRKMETPILIFPEILFWNQTPERTNQIFNSSATKGKGFVSAIFTILLKSRESFIRITPPINLKEEIEKSKNHDNRWIARDIRNRILETFYHEKRSVLGPTIKSRQEMMERVLFHPNILKKIRELSLENMEKEKHLRKKAYKYFNEIAADFSINYIKFLDKVLDYIFKKVFKGIVYEPNDFVKIREASKNGPLILIPSHKSHMDYLILSSLFFKNKIIPPHILAGSNLAFFPMGKIFRRSGAFFMRRSFKGIELYGEIFKQYVKILVNEGYSIEFFIEGGRTRTGRLMNPKMGMLKYLLDAIEEGYNKDLIFVPISINYSRIIEEASYTKELIGKDKTVESTSSFLKSRKLLKRNYGTVFVKANSPISFNQIKNNFQEKKFTENFANFLLSKINDTILITPFPFITTVMLALNKTGFSIEELKKSSNLLLSFWEKTDLSLKYLVNENITLDSIITMVANAYKKDEILFNLSINDKIISLEDEYKNEEDIYLIPQEKRSQINFYKNTIAHAFLPLSFYSISILILNYDKDKTYNGDILTIFNQLKEIFFYGYIFPNSDLNDKELLKIISEYFQEKMNLNLDEDLLLLDIDILKDLKFLGNIVRDYIEGFLVILSVLKQYDGKKTNKKEFIKSARSLGGRMFYLNKILLSESLSVPNFNSALETLIKLKIISNIESGKKNIVLKINDEEKFYNLKNFIKLVLKILN